jgi:hypothetical protein
MLDEPQPGALNHVIRFATRRQASGLGVLARSVFHESRGPRVTVVEPTDAWE